ncbi:hypothetical protein AB0K15_41635 [Amycolatopsis sp. NPDC049253]|uniref:hypothetical protein n=1 Tax=Amycolatopsis sp. NPDC049253 TaxID=3155274 RepID=UPI0034455B42
MLVLVIAGVGANDRRAEGLQPSRAAHEAVTSSDTTTDGGIGAAAILRAAGLLHAHIENLEQLICDPYTATATATADGFDVHVTYPGPANLTVFAETFDERSSEQHKTIGGQEAGETFSFTGLPFDQVMAISVSERSDRGPGTCDVFDRTP